MDLQSTQIQDGDSQRIHHTRLVSSLTKDLEVHVGLVRDFLHSQCNFSMIFFRFSVAKGLPEESQGHKIHAEKSRGAPTLTSEIFLYARPTMTTCSLRKSSSCN